MLVRLLGIFIITGLMLSCSGSQEDPAETKAEQFMQITSKVVEQYSETGTETENIEYVYNSPKDFFWAKAVHKDGSGEIIKEVVRELDDKGMPVTEKIIELETVTETSDVKYCPHSYFLLEKTIYNGEKNENNMTMKVKNNYEEGWLLNQETEIYSTDPEYKNENGSKLLRYFKLRFFPSKESRPKGPNETIFFVEEMKTFCSCKEGEECDSDKSGKHAGEGMKKGHGEGKNKKDSDKKECKYGHLESFTTTEFSPEGYPVHMKTTAAGCENDPTEEWYKIEKDGIGNVISITGYNNKEMTETTGRNHKIFLEYNSEGLISKSAEYKYNKETEKFDRMHDVKTFKWVDPGFMGHVKVLYPTKTEENYCYGSKTYSKTATTIEKFENGEKIITKSSFSQESDAPMDNAELKPKEKIIMKYNLLTRENKM